MGNLTSTFSVTAIDLIILSTVAWMLLATGLFAWRWLSKVAGHPIGQNPSVKAIP